MLTSPLNTNDIAAPAAIAGIQQPALLRTALLASCALAAAAAFALGRPDVYLTADPDLALLLRGIALIKATMVLGALGVLWWRFGLPLSGRVAAGYLAGAAAISGATMLIWQLTFIGAAALAFDGGALILLVLALRDRQRD
jgi:hypothetical protein